MPAPNPIVQERHQILTRSGVAITIEFTDEVVLRGNWAGIEIDHIIATEATK